MATVKTELPFCGNRLRTARMFVGWSQEELGARVGVSHQYIGYLETGHKVPQGLTLGGIADCLGFQPPWFFGKPLVEFRDDECFFRRRQATPISVRNRVLAHGTLFGYLVDHLEAVLRVRLPPNDIPSIDKIDSLEDIEKAAERCRMQWGLGIDVPISNVIRVVERAGVVVTRFDGSAQTIDAFSRPHRRNIIVLNNDKGSSSRSVFDVAHECGHLVLHGGVDPGHPDQERQADQFASAFLMPRQGFLREFPRPTREFWSKHYWQSLLAMKEQWKVSVAAIVRRAFDLRVIDAAQYARAYKYMSAKGWLRGEPGEFKADEPELVRICFERLRERLNVTFEDVARQLYWHCSTLAWVTGIRVAEQPAPQQLGTVVPIALAQIRRGIRPLQTTMPFDSDSKSSLEPDTN